MDRIGNDNAKREFYLTDIVAIARAQGLLCRVAELPAEELLGVNTRGELAAAEALMPEIGIESGVSLDSFYRAEGRKQGKAAKS